MFNFQFGCYNLDGLFGGVLDLWIWSAFHKAAYSFETYRLGLRIFGTDIWISKLSTAFFCCDFRCLWWKCQTFYSLCVLVHHHEETFKPIWNPTREPPPDTPHGCPKFIKTPMKQHIRQQSPRRSHTNRTPCQAFVWAALWWLGDDRSRLNCIASALNPLGVTRSFSSQWSLFR